MGDFLPAQPARPIMPDRLIRWADREAEGAIRVNVEIDGTIIDWVPVRGEQSVTGELGKMIAGLESEFPGRRCVLSCEYADEEPQRSPPFEIGVGPGPRVQHPYTEISLSFQRALADKDRHLDRLSDDLDKTRRTLMQLVDRFQQVATQSAEVYKARTDHEIRMKELEVEQRRDGRRDDLWDKLVDTAIERFDGVVMEGLSSHAKAEANGGKGNVAHHMRNVMVRSRLRRWLANVKPESRARILEILQLQEKDVDHVELPRLRERWKTIDRDTRDELISFCTTEQIAILTDLEDALPKALEAAKKGS